MVWHMIIPLYPFGFLQVMLFLAPALPPVSVLLQTQTVGIELCVLAYWVGLSSLELRRNRLITDYTSAYAG